MHSLSCGASPVLPELENLFSRALTSGVLSFPNEIANTGNALRSVRKQLKTQLE